MKPMNLDDLLFAIESNSIEMRESGDLGIPFLYRTEGRIIFSSDAQYFDEDELKEEFEYDDFIRIPEQRDLDDYRIMEKFIWTRDEAEQKMLGSAIHGRGAFRRFRNVLEELEIEDAWYAFRDREHLRFAAHWCRENNIPFDAKGYEKDLQDLDEYE